jgi:hypothetical protein
MATFAHTTIPLRSLGRRPSRSTYRHPRWRSRHVRLRLNRQTRHATARHRGHRHRTNGSQEPLDSPSSAQTAVTDTTPAMGCALGAASRRGHPIRRHCRSLCGNPNSLQLRPLPLGQLRLRSLRLGQSHLRFLHLRSLLPNPLLSPLLLRPLQLSPLLPSPLLLLSLLPVLFPILTSALLPPTR